MAVFLPTNLERLSLNVKQISVQGGFLMYWRVNELDASVLSGHRGPWTSQSERRRLHDDDKVTIVLYEKYYTDRNCSKMFRDTNRHDSGIYPCGFSVHLATGNYTKYLE